MFKKSIFFTFNNIMTKKYWDECKKFNSFMRLIKKLLQIYKKDFV